MTWRVWILLSVWPLLLFGLEACATDAAPAPQARVVTVEVPVARPCIPRDQVPDPPPAYADADLANAPDAAERYRLVAAANAQRKARLAVVEPAIAACR